jgi:imidazolonepropionase-like amidohydrolase
MLGGHHSLVRRRCFVTRTRCLIAVVILALCVPLAAFTQRAGSLQPRLFAIRDARVVTEPGKVLERATIVVRDGLIAEVGVDATVPAGALVVEGKGKTVYAGFVDALGTWGYDPALRRSEAGPAAVEDLTSEALAATKPDNRKGITPEFQTATALTVGEEVADNWRRAGVTARLVAPEGGFFSGQSALVSLSGAAPRETVLRATVAQHLAFRPVAGSDYPRVLMGIISHCRQTLLDAGYYQRQWQRFTAGGEAGKRPPFDPALAELGTLLDRKLPVVIEADTRDEIHRALDFAKEFNLRPILFGGRNAGKVVERLQAEKVPVILRLNVGEGRLPTGRRGEDPTPPGEREPIPQPERVKQEEDRLGKIEREMAKVLAAAGVRFAFASSGLTGDKPWEKQREQVRKLIDAGLSPEAALRALTTDAAEILGASRQLGRIAPGLSAHLILTDGDFQKAETQIHEVFADGVRFRFDVKPREKKPEPDKKAGEEKKADPEKAANLPTEIEADRVPKVKTKGTVLIRGATLLTVGPQGNLAATDLLVKDGKIADIGKGLPAPEGVAVIDASGMFIMPGIIDTHCHFAASGGINEFSLSVVPEVRIRDILNSEDVQIYRALAGGVTTARVLHGSANVIGGQDAVLKLKYGEPASAMLVTSGPRGVKFALGENVKRTDGRFPNTRLGVEAVLVRAFSEALAYKKTWDDYRQAENEGKVVPEPRRDLRLEALADVLSGELKVHCHCYRADEILMLLRVADRFGFKVQSLQHVLEGYKIAPEIAAHGASCSTFSDWWAYKIEAYDAIPYNAALLNQAGATVCMKSDSNELMRHLYQEAAKAIKYGGMGEQEALKTITVNGAKQLGIEKRVGTLKTGKDADLAIFNGHPLNSFSRVEMTLVEGEVYFQRDAKLTPFKPAAQGPPVLRPPLAQVRISPSGRYLLRDVHIHTVSGADLQNGCVLIAKGKIAGIFPDAKAPAVGADVTVIPCTGLHLYPGMIDASTVLGLTELGSARETQDFAEGGDFQPDLRASTAVNPDSELIPVTRANGVTSVVTRPTGSLVAGQAALINLAGWVPREMVVRDPLGLSIEFPGARATFTGDPVLPVIGRAIARKQREEKIRKLRDLFAQALAHDEALKSNPTLPANPRLEALVPYARGERPVLVSANREREIREALKLADDLHWKVILTGGIDAWKVADELKKRDVPVILGPIMTMPQENFDRYDAPFTAAAKLHEAGVRFCIRTAGTTNVRNLPYEAAFAVSYGLPPEEGLKAVTLNAARILGVEKELGSIEPDKRANLILTTGDPLQVTTQTQLVFIDGKPIEPTSKHTRLYERYLERLREVQKGQAPLGTK